MVSAPMINPEPMRAATAAALAWAARWASSRGKPVMKASSSRSTVWTSKLRPSILSSSERRGEAEARTSLGAVSAAGIVVLCCFQRAACDV